ncbi:MAG: GtrA family protein [Lapillicoccus sp.]
MVDSPRPGLFDRIRGVVDIFWREVAKFGVIGAGGFIIDFGGFNLLFYGPLAGHLTTSKVISGVVATAFAWVGNRMWTFRHRRNRPAHHEALLFFAVNGVGLVISTLWLNFSHDILNLTSRSAVNLNTIIGIGLATIFRFWMYRQFVFAGEHPGDPEPEEAGVTAPPTHTPDEQSRRPS